MIQAYILEQLDFELVFYNFRIYQRTGVNPENTVLYDHQFQNLNIFSSADHIYIAASRRFCCGNQCIRLLVLISSLLENITLV